MVLCGAVRWGWRRSGDVPGPAQEAADQVRGRFFQVAWRPAVRVPAPDLELHRPGRSALLHRERGRQVVLFTFVIVTPQVGDPGLGDVDPRAAAQGLGGDRGDGESDPRFTVVTELVIENAFISTLGRLAIVNEPSEALTVAL